MTASRGCAGAKTPQDLTNKFSTGCESAGLEVRKKEKFYRGGREGNSAVSAEKAGKRRDILKIDPCLAEAVLRNAGTEAELRGGLTRGKPK
jgi:hypothetical protein